MNLRPTTNLIVPEHLVMPRELQKARFMYVYTKAYEGAPSLFMTKLWVSYFFPSIYNDPKFKNSGRSTSEQLRKMIPSGTLSLKKVMDGKNPHFVVSVPLISFPTSTSPLSFLLEWFLGGSKSRSIVEPTAQHLQESSDFVGLTEPENRGVSLQEPGGADEPKVLKAITVPADKILGALTKLSGNAKLMLKQTLIQVRIQESVANKMIIFADFKITKEEAQQLTTTDWPQLRAIDLYPLLLSWVSSVFGERAPAPTASFPISRIAFTLPKNHSEAARINEYGISIDPKGNPAYLPREVDKQQTIAYEDRYTQAGSRDDGTFTLVDPKGGTAEGKLPANMVVCIDWVNNKFSYTNSSGMLNVDDLVRYRAADITHIRNLLDEKVSESYMERMLGLGIAAGVPFNVDLRDSDFTGDFAELAAYKDSFLKLDSLEYVYERAARIWRNKFPQEPVRWEHLSTVGFPLFRPIARYLKKVEAAALANLDSVYLKYAVSTVTAILPWIIIVSKYSDKIDEVKAKDLANRAPAINQEADPNWKPASIPLLSDEIGFLPHQRKVRSLLKDSPDLALVPIQAGGGKSLIALTDVLYEIKANRNEPYLIMCPDGLVAGYVKEIVYFTKGKLNCIPITSIAVRQSGYKRLQAIMEAAPRNTVVVVGYDALRFRPKALTYGTTPIKYFPVIDFLRQFRFGYVFMDESHKAKNDSLRTKAIMELVTDIPKKRLASGTMVHDSPSDLALQIIMLDPTLFGDRENFNATYGLEVKGDRVITWKPGAQAAIMRKIKERIVYAGAMRKEWAAFLPKKREWIGGVELTPMQHAVYNDLLNKVIEEIEEAAKTNKELQKFLAPSDPNAKLKEKEKEQEQNGEDIPSEIEEEENNIVEDNENEDLAGLLRPYLARLERFLIAPGSDPLGAAVLKGDDLISPKTMAILERVKLHLFGGEIEEPKTGRRVKYGPFPGKVLIFTNSIISAEEIFRLADGELKKCGLLYKAKTKLEDGAVFEKSNRVKWMVGVEQSMNEGLNYQFAGRLIRSETVWNPGTLEQGNSRINRPELKKTESRKEIFFDTIVANRTIDITKTARLISKIIAAEKFENAANPAYEAIPDVPAISMKLESIRNFNSWHSLGPDQPGLEEYARAQSIYESVRNEDYQNYKDAYIAKYGSAPALEPIPVAPTPPDAKLLKRVPYTPGLSLYGENQLGLVRLDEYINMNSPVDVEEDEDTEGEDDEDAKPMKTQLSPEMEAHIRSVVGKLVHTEYGEGIIKSIAPRSRALTVELLDGYAVRIRRNQVFLINRKETSTKDIRNQILKSIGNLPIVNPIDVPADAVRPSSKKRAEKRIEEEKKQKVIKERQIKESKDADLSIELYFVVTNGYLGIDYPIDEDNQVASQTLTACGFRPSEPYYFSKVRNTQALKAQMKLWKDKGLMPDPLLVKQGIPQAFQEMYNLLQTGQIKNHKATVKQLAGRNVVNFYRITHKANNNKLQFKPYPIIEDGQAFIALPANGQAGTREAMRYKRPSFTWRHSSPTLSYFGTKQQVVQKLKEIIEAGVTVTNIVELRKEFTRLKALSFRNPSGEGIL